MSPNGKCNNRDIGDLIDAGVKPKVLEFNYDNAHRFQFEDISQLQLTDKLTLFDSGGNGGWVQQVKVYRGNGGANTDDHFGSGVATNGEYIFVGAPFDDTQNHIAGSITIFKHNGTAWVQTQYLQCPDPTGYRHFGEIIRIKGADEFFTTGDRQHLWHYKLIAGVWTHQQTIESTCVGKSLAVYGDELWSGGGAGGTNGFDRYRWNGSTWQLYQHLPMPTLEQYFGSSCAVGANWGFIGSPNDRTEELYSGSVHFYEKSGSVWTETQELTIPGSGVGQYFGKSMIFNGTQLFVADGKWNVYVLEHTGTEWEVVNNPVNPNHGSQFGSSLFFYNDLLYAGGGGRERVDNFAEGSGKVWGAVSTIQSDPVVDGDSFAGYQHSIGIHSGIMVIGAGYDADDAPGGGAAYIFKEDGAYQSEQAYYMHTNNQAHLDLSRYSQIHSCTIINDQPNNTSINGLVSFNGRHSWMKWNGTTWEVHAGGLENLSTGNTIAEIEAGLSEFDLTSQSFLDFAFDLRTLDINESPSIERILINPKK